jgi:DNA-binding NtrC family response regulator
MREAEMQGKMQVMIGTPDVAIWQRFTDLLNTDDISLVPFNSIEQACEALTHDNVLLILCEDHLADGTYEDLLAAAKNIRSRARIVVTGLDPEQFDCLGYCRARELGAFDVLQKSCGIKDLEWVVICALRDETGARTASSWSDRN